MGRRLIRRIRRLELRDFRGFREPHALDLDADVVILTGSNGYGKTSLIDALNLLLNGLDPRLAEETLVHAGRGQAEVTAEVVAAGESGGSTPGPLHAEVRPGEPPEIHGQPTPELTSEVCSAASVFYQDHLHRAVEDGYLDSIVRDFLVPPLGLLDEAKQALKETRAVLREAALELAPAGVEAEETLAADRLEAVCRLTDAWAEAHLLLPEELPELTGIYDFESSRLRDSWREELLDLTGEVARNLDGIEEPLDPDYTPESCLSLLAHGVGSLLSSLGRQVEGSEPTTPSAVLWELQPLADGQELRVGSSLPLVSSEKEDEPPFLPLPWTPAAEASITERIESLDGELASLEEELGDLRAWQRHYRPEEGPALPDLLRALASQVTRWADEPKANRAAPVARLPARARERLQALAAVFDATPDSPDQAFTRWEESLIDAIQPREERHRHLSRRRDRLVAVLRAGGKLRRLPPGRRGKLAALKKRGGFTVGELREKLEALGGEAQGGGDPMAALRRLHQALSRWLEVESRQAKRDRQLESLPEYRRAREILDAGIAAVTAELSPQGVLQSARRIPAGPLRDVASVLTDVLRRFRLVDGVLPAELRAEGPGGEQTLCYRLGQGRSLRSLSAGQQAQFGLAQMVALNLAFSRRLGHRVLLFDDVVTAFDLAQLVPTCVLLRQLAYGDPEAGDSPAAGQTGGAQDRRQIILSSHREDLTNRLIDLLLPPRNRSLKVVTFTRFDAERGPGYEIYEATASAGAAGVRAKLGGLLDLALED